LLNVANPATLFNTDLWLEIKIGNNTPLAPRQPLVSVAYAMKADSVKDGSITTNSLAANAVTTTGASHVSRTTIPLCSSQRGERP